MIKIEQEFFDYNNRCNKIEYFVIDKNEISVIKPNDDWNKNSTCRIYLKSGLYIDSNIDYNKLLQLLEI